MHMMELFPQETKRCGYYFCVDFVVSALLFGKMNKEIIIYLVLIVIEMFTGFFDDAAEKPWEVFKGNSGSGGGSRCSHFLSALQFQ